MNLGSCGGGGEVEFNLQGLNSTPPLEPRTRVEFNLAPPPGTKITTKVLWEFGLN